MPLVYAANSPLRDSESAEILKRWISNKTFHVESDGDIISSFRWARHPLLRRDEMLMFCRPPRVSYKVVGQYKKRKERSEAVIKSPPPTQRLERNMQYLHACCRPSIKQKRCSHRSRSAVNIQRHANADILFPYVTVRPLTAYRTGHK